MPSHPTQPLKRAALLNSGALADAETVIAFCKERIAGYKCPRSVAFREAPLPVSGAGKVLKRQLREEYVAAAAKSA